MQFKIFKKKYPYILVLVLMLTGGASAQIDSTNSYPDFDSQLLKLKVPDAFQKSSLKLEIFADSSWQLYQGTIALDFPSAMHLLGQSEAMLRYAEHLHKESEYLHDYRSRRVFSIIASVGGAAYITFVWSKGWVYQIPGYAALAIGGVRYLESRTIEAQALREQYFLKNLIQPSKVQRLVDDYNFKLYQFLSTAGIQFSDS